VIDTTIHAKTLARQIRQSDFHSTVWSFSASDKQNVITDALAVAATGFNSVALRINTIAGKPIYRHAYLSEALLTRHISESVRRVTKVRQTDRQAIVKSIVALAEEGIAFNVFKLDIKSFYETINTAEIVRMLRSDAAFSRQSINVLESFFASLAQRGILGLPRGIGLSATLSEYLMRAFDEEISNSPGVRFYSRYVDDVIMIVSEKTDMAALRLFAEAKLPQGLFLNRRKTMPFVFRPYSRNNTGVSEDSIDFLGYRISIGEITRDSESRMRRDIHVDISAGKVKKIKRRVAMSLLQFNGGGSYRDLLDRIKLLTSNYGFLDAASGEKRYSGLRYNYGAIDPARSDALVQLDRFLLNALCSSNVNNRIRPNLTAGQRRQLISLQFTTGFVANRFFTFSYDDVQRIIGCWSHA
jgi:hypothetical protein